VMPMIKNQKTSLFLEDKSLSTLENIKFIGERMNFTKEDEITVFCDNVRPPRVMWLILHYWLRLNQKDIEKYFVNYAADYYRKHYTTAQIGKEMSKGYVYDNLTIKSYFLKESIDEAVYNQMGTVMEILALYDKDLETLLDNAVRKKHGLE
jgi:hypothetical protein